MLNRPAVANTVLLSVLIAAIFHTIWAYGALPEQVASHFGLDGEADDWVNSRVFLAFYVTFMACMSAMFFLIGPTLRYLPAELINIPNREYWMDEIRHDETMFVIASSLSWYGVAVNILGIAFFHTTFAVSIAGGSTLPATSSIVMGVLLTMATIGLIARLFVRFRRPAS